eukprot:scaffold90789_cov30-Tisochrysis_lutea.AAC.1
MPSKRGVWGEPLKYSHRWCASVSRPTATTSRMPDPSLRSPTRGLSDASFALLIDQSSVAALARLWRLQPPRRPQAVYYPFPCAPYFASPWLRAFGLRILAQVVATPRPAQEEVAPRPSECAPQVHASTRDPGHEESTHLWGRELLQLLANHVLNSLIELNVILRDDGDCPTGAPRTRRAPNAVDVVLGIRREVAPSGHVCGNEDGALARLELVERREPLRLGELAVKRYCSKAERAQRQRDALGIGTGGDEDDRGVARQLV